MIKLAAQINEKRAGFLVDDGENTDSPHGKIKFLFISFIKIDFRGIKDHCLGDRGTIRLMEKNVEEYLCDVRAEKNFLNKNPKE